MKNPFLEFNGQWLKQGSMVKALYMYQFLQISPSYALAHHIHTEGIEFPEQILLAADLYETSAEDDAFREIWLGFERVLENYELFGDVFSTPFPIWWDEHQGYELFGYVEPKPEATLITSVPRNKKPDATVSDSINRYFLKARPALENPPVHILAVPAGIGTKKQIALVKQLLQSIESDVEATPYAVSKPEFEFKGERFRPNALSSYLRVFFFRAALRDKSLWQIGALAQISKKHSANIPNPLTARPNGGNAYTRENLNVLTNRAILRAQRTAEHAAQGDFPKHEPIQLPRHDWEQINELIKTLPPNRISRVA